MASLTRSDGRGSDQIRPISIEVGFQKNPEGSVLYRCGGTRVLISASVDEAVPGWMRGKGNGWVTAEYAMHPRANPQRKEREGRRGQIDGRTQEIQRLIGRSLRSVVRLDRLGERQILVDCDVLDADGGTRTASITGGFVAMALALGHLRRKNLLSGAPLRGLVAATSVGLLDGVACLDLSYAEDSQADVDMNVVRTDLGGYVELQGTGEKRSFTPAELQTLLDLAIEGTNRLFEHQRAALRDVLPALLPRP
jgi:ribonuclease PH